ncbi:hypothetical protein [Spirulina sp. CCNP1310]|nr:hypothetical protein [Spirulina sp. CCNP1310]
MQTLNLILLNFYNTKPVGAKNLSPSPIRITVGAKNLSPSPMGD